MSDFDKGYADGYREVWWNTKPKFPPGNVLWQARYDLGYSVGQRDGAIDVARGYSGHYGKRWSA